MAPLPFSPYHPSSAPGSPQMPPNARMWWVPKLPGTPPPPGIPSMPPGMLSPPPRMPSLPPGVSNGAPHPQQGAVPQLGAGPRAALQASGVLGQGEGLQGTQMQGSHQLQSHPLPHQQHGRPPHYPVYPTVGNGVHWQQHESDSSGQAGIQGSHERQGDGQQQQQQHPQEPARQPRSEIAQASSEDGDRDSFICSVPVATCSIGFGQICIYAPYMTVCAVISLLKTPYI
jgi:hypothetical protein